MSSSSEQPGNEPPSVRWHDMVKFVRQLSHDIRNNLNAVELQSAYLAELAEETEMKNEIQRLRETKVRFELSTENWGREPLRNVSQGHYGLGLNRARSITEAHGGNFRAEYDQKTSTLVTTLTLPSFPSEKR